MKLKFEKKRKLFYCSAKSGLINFLSGLRQELNGKINVLTVIPGYISTNSFNENSYQFLITSPEKMSKKIYEAIKKNKEIIYVGGIWRILMFLILQRIIKGMLAKKTLTKARVMGS